jgi:hypothetical protein
VVYTRAMFQTKAKSKTKAKVCTVPYVPADVRVTCFTKQRSQSRSQGLLALRAQLPTVPGIKHSAWWLLFGNYRNVIVHKIVLTDAI